MTKEGISIKCPKCSTIITPLSPKPNTQVRCRCGATIVIKGRGFTTALESRARLKKTISRLSTNLKIKL